MPILEVEGTPIYYEVEGRDDGPWLVFSNSLGTNLSMWDAQASALGDRFRILRYDSRGHGRSGVPEGPYTMDRLGQDAATLMNALGIERASFCGLSMGGMVGMWLGVNAPDRVERLALCNTGAFMPPPELWNERIKIATAKGMEALAGPVIERWFSPDFRQRADGTVDRVREMLLSTPAQGYAGCCAAIRDMDQRETIRAIGVPTIVIAGKQDPATPPDRGEAIAAAIPGARYLLLDTAHLSNVEAEPEFTAALARFLE